MFRPNRIGTPYIHTADFANNVAALTLNSDAMFAQAYGGHVINATPSGDFGRQHLNWSNASSLPSGHRVALLFQYTITRPITGDTVGIEANAGILLQGPNDLLIRPIFGKLDAAGGAVLANVEFADGPTALDQAYGDLTANGSVNKYFNCSMQKQIIARYTNATLSGTYAHGFQIENPNAAAASIPGFIMTGSVRQLNDQNNVGYRDTLR